MPIPIGTAAFQSWDYDALRLMCRPVSSSIDMAPAYLVARDPKTCRILKVVVGFFGLSAVLTGKQHSESLLTSSGRGDYGVALVLPIIESRE